MKVLQKWLSPEPCEEAGWVGYDYQLDAPMAREDILRLRPLGAFSYLPQLRQPFYKVENDHFLVKGLQGQATVRVGVHRAHTAELTRVEAMLEGRAEPDVC